MRRAILFLSFTALGYYAFAQNITSKKSGVSNDVVINTAEDAKEIPGFTSTENAERLIASIMDVIGLEPNFKIKTANIPNVQADIRHRQRLILYNPDFISQVNLAAKDKWPSIFILAHEIGHHLNGHTVLGTNSRPNVELEADQFAGFALCKMGATLEETQLAMHIIATKEASRTHPGRNARLAAIEKGWNKASRQLNK